MYPEEYPGDRKNPWLTLSDRVPHHGLLAHTGSSDHLSSQAVRASFLPLLFPRKALHRTCRALTVGDGQQAPGVLGFFSAGALINFVHLDQLKPPSSAAAALLSRAPSPAACETEGQGQLLKLKEVIGTNFSGAFTCFWVFISIEIFTSKVRKKARPWCLSPWHLSLWYLV